jgi:gliding motility-associated-like protein
MMKQIIPFFLFFISFSLNSVIGQNQFDRLYMLNDTTQMIGLKCIPTQSDGYAMASVTATESDTVFLLNVTNFDPKGNVNWSTDYDLQTEGGANISVDLMQRTDGGLILSAMGDPTVNQNKYLLSLSQAGDILWAKRFGGEDSSQTAVIGVYTEELSNGDIVFSANTSVDTIIKEDIYTSVLDAEGNIKWSQIIDYNFNDVDIPLELRHSVVSSDTSYSLLGLVDTIGFAPFITTIDTFGNILKSVSYVDTMDLTAISPFGLDQALDGSMVISGALNDFTTQAVDGAVLKIGPDGEPVWGRRMQISPLGLTVINDAKFKDNGNIVASGSTLIDIDFGTFTFFILEFFVEFDPNGEVVYSVYNPSEFRFLTLAFNDIHEIFPTSDGGAIYGTNSFNVFVGLFTPELMKLDANGSYGCQDTLDFEFAEPFLYGVDTLLLTTSPISNQDTLSAISEQVSPFNLTVLTLPSIPYCPNVPIDTILDATVDGGVEYIWSTGDTTEMIRVMEEGEYSVTVTIIDENCYMLCDTAMITVYDEPELSLGLNFASLCGDNSINIFGLPEVEAGIASYMWSTNETTPNINVTEPGTYSLTIIDNCDLSASASIDVSLEDFYMPGEIVSLIVDPTSCFNGGQEVIAEISGDVPSTGIQWSNGDQGNTSIFGLPNQSYTLTITDICNLVQQETIAVEPGTAQISVNTECSGDTISLSVGGPQSFLSTMWTLPDGSTSQETTIRTIQAGVYLVNVIDACGNAGSAQYELTNGEIFLCNGRFCELDDPSSGCLCFPRVFVPNSMIEENKAFGPANFCGGLATNYRLEIFNRWGKKVFETTVVDEDWPGTIDGEFAPADVYIYKAEYTFEGEVFQRNGDVTLIR